MHSANVEVTKRVQQVLVIIKIANFVKNVQVRADDSFFEISSWNFVDTPINQLQCQGVYFDLVKN